MSARVRIGPDGRARCDWGALDPLSLTYHDEEWGTPSRDERHLFEMLVLEGAQAGLSWATILRKRDGYRRAFAGFDPVQVAAFGDVEVTRLMGDASIVRNRAKIEAAITNARAVMSLADQGSSLTAFLWSYVDGRPLDGHRRRLAEIPAETDASRRMSRDLRARGFRFVGPTICYAFMQAVGMVNDHILECFRHAEVAAMAS